MAETRVIADLSRLLSTRLEGGVAALLSERSKREASVFAISHVGDLEASEVPAIGLYLHDVHPDSARRHVGHSIESDHSALGSPTAPAYLRRAPLWLRCRYAVVFRASGCYEEQELLTAVLQVLLDRPVVRRDELPSLASDPLVDSCGDAYDLRLVGEENFWRSLGLAVPRLMVPFEVTLPLPAGQRLEVGRIFERDLSFEELTQEKQ
jgi:hypothetical protein